MSMLNLSSTVLIVDDEESGRDILKGLLLKQGYHLDFASNGSEALAKASQLTPDLILLDVMMPEMDGFEVCQHIRNDPHLGEIPILLITALDDQASRMQGIEAGADDFISKPFNGAELKTRVRTITRLNRYRRLLVERMYRQEAEQEVYRRNKELTLLNNVITTVASTFDAKEIVHIACDAMTQIFEGFSSATAVLFNQKSKQSDTVIEYNSAEFSLKQPHSNIAAMSHSETISLVSHLSYQEIKACTAPQVFVRGQYGRQLPHIDRLMNDYDINTLILIPLLAHDETIGFIELKSNKPFHAHERTLHLAQSLAAAVSQSLEASKLYGDLQQYVENLKGIVAEQTFELRMERDRTKAILDALGEAVVVTDVSGVVEYVNPAVEQLTGYKNETIVGQKWNFLNRTDAEMHLSEKIGPTVRSGLIWRGEVYQNRQDNSFYDAALTVAPLFDPHLPDHVIGFVSVQRDISPIKDAERLKDKFVANVTHELSTPLSIATLLADNLGLLYEHIEDEKRRKMIQNIQKHMRVLNNLVDNVLEISHLDNKNTGITKQPINLAALLSEGIEEQRPLAQSKQQTLKFEGCSQLIVSGDEGQLQQVVRNLISNAIKYTPDQGYITCKCVPLSKSSSKNEGKHEEWPGFADLPSQDWAALQIVDTGIGISHSDLPYLFERFFRVKDQENIRGTGLGLSIVKELVKRHAGHVAVNSTPNEGSVFAVYLPLQPLLKENVL
ncbi:MAG: response regulator [Anaerolineae bacterium]|nr:response regulator [Anaerolineae bacterium]